MGLLDAELVEQTTDREGEVAERVAVVDVLRRLPVARQVRDDHPEPVGEHVDVAGVVRRPGRSGPTAVEQDDRVSGARLGDEQLAVTDSTTDSVRGTRSCTSMWYLRSVAI